MLQWRPRKVEVEASKFTWCGVPLFIYFLQEMAPES
jgi:hypothetical protein